MKFLKTKLGKRIVLGATLLLILTIFVPRVVQAKYIMQTKESNVLEEYKQSLEAKGTNLPQWNLYNMNYTTMGLNRLLIGVPVLEGEGQANRGGAAGLFAGLIDGLYQNKPVSSGQYLAHLGRNLEIVKPAYAQGKGWRFLEPVLTLWKAVRDICYLLFVIVFVAIGFMIMFRQKLDPQTAVSIQNALPKIIVSLVLVTFSYAICGLIIDLIYLGNALLMAIFGPALETAGIFSWDPDLTIIGFIDPNKPFIKGLTGITGGIGGMAGGLIKILIGAIWDVFSKGDFGNVLLLVIGFALISAIIKIFFALLSRYVMLLLYTIVSPFMFLWGSLPGQAEHISKFFKSLLSSALTFPAMLLMFQLAGFFVVVGKSLPLEPIVPFQIPAKDFGQAIGGFIALGILMAASKMPETIEDLLGVKAVTAPALGAETAGALRRIPVIGGLMG